MAARPSRLVREVTLAWLAQDAASISGTQSSAVKCVGFHFRRRVN
jgi:hypothetical protein